MAIIQPKSNRIAAVDVMRALTMTLMLFVNDIAGLQNIPHWLLHAEINEDMMGFSDTIFPAFIFCMGMSVVLAIDTRYRKGDTPLQLIGHIFTRSFALIAMGLFTLNCSEVGFIPYSWFTILMVIGFFLTWGVYPESSGWRNRLNTVLKCAGMALLLFLFVYKDISGSPFSTGWWGILGLIGWTYAVCSLIYLFTGNSLKVNFIVWIALILLSLGTHSSLIPYDYASRWILLTFIPSDWTLHALGMSGILTALLMKRFRQNGRRLFTITIILGAIMLVCGLVSHPYWIISKIQATPTWMFYCLAMFFPIFGLLYILCDLHGGARYFSLIRPAGTATLTAYMIPYVWYSVMSLIGVWYPSWLCSGYPGLIRSALFAIVVVMLTGLLSKIKIRLKV